MTQLIIFVINFIQILANLLTFLIIGRVLASWFTMGAMGSPGKITRFLYDVTDPVLKLVKKLPHKIGMFDLSPIIALFGIDLLSRLIILLLVNIA